MSTKDNDYDDEGLSYFMKRWIIWVVGLMIVISIVAFFMNRTVATVDNGITHYEEFTELYQTCQRINTDLCAVKALPETDRQFTQFSQQQQVLTLKKQLNRWIEDYNGKSKMINRSLWKSSALPYQLTVQEFSCY